MERWLQPRVGFGLVAALYLLSFPYHPKLRSPNELCRLFQSRSLIDFGTINILEELKLHGSVGDLSCTATVRDANGERLLPCVGPDAPARQNVVSVAYYPSKAPLLSYLGAPVYWVLKQVSGEVTELQQIFWSRLFITLAPALLMLVLLRRFLAAYVEPPTADLFTVVYALGTIAFSNAELFMSHQLTAVLLFTSFYCAWQVERGAWSLRGYALAGLSAGAAVVCEYTSVLGVLCVAAYVVAARWKKWGELAKAAGLVVVSSAPLLLFLGWYHQAAFGSPLASGYKFLNDAQYMHWHQGGFLGIKLPYWEGFAHSFFSPLRGLFAISPVLAVSFFGLRAVKERDRALFVLLVALLASHTYFTSSFDHTSWGWTVGPRHLTGLLPFLFLPIALAWERARSQPLPFALIGGLALSSLAASLLVTGVNYIPSDISTSVFGLVLPLYAEGFLPVSWLAAWVPNPASGALLLALSAAAVAWAGARLWQAKTRLVVVLLVAGAHFGVLKLATRDLGGDTAALNFMKSVWLAPAGAHIDFRRP